MPAERPPVDQLTVCTRLCEARCCRYVTVQVGAPRSRADWDEVRWWLAHEGTMVTKDEDGWLLHVATPCTHLAADGRCGVYAHRPHTCAKYDAMSCEYTDDVPFEVQLHSETDLADYLERRKLKRGADVAQAIRASLVSRPCAPLVALRPLAHR